ncbi:MAG: type II transport protein GspH [Burkholderiales bacterium]|nr:type II transport protein GspH [Burkholderiales bacterium]
MIEILVVLAIMAIGAAFVVPMVSGQGATTGELKSAARQIAAGLRLARSEAVTSRRETALTLDLEARSFHVANDAREVALPRKVDLELFTAQSDLVSDKRGAIRFFPDGGSNGGRVTVSSGERRYEVDVDWLTGRVAILDQ